MNNIIVSIPRLFQHPLFFTQREIEIQEIGAFDETLKDMALLYDLLHEVNREACDKPWEEQEIYVPHIFEHWKKEKGEIAEYFKKRDRNRALQPMVLSLGHFISAVFWINSVPVPSLSNLTEEIQTLPYKPMNAGERIGFLLDQPNQYHSYVQLGELYQELEKIYYKLLTMKKRTSQF
ncbi:YpoC family protein [Priestia abyssalis]|uniref:YpoC family protein n=1 Tax=Priestia abyssalis TaxID=1221450 RepID=UPI000994EE65|nr:hypothetical protein [Priestia abyssalis]